MSSFKNSIYSLIDFFTVFKGIPRKINGYTIRFPAKWARYFEANYEQENVAFLSKTCKEGMVVIDIGAHLGLMSIIIAKLVGKNGKVYSFEPTPKTFDILKTIIHINKCDTIIQPINKAISNFVGLVDFFVDSNEGSNANSLVNRKDKSRTSQKIEVNTLDNCVKNLNLTKLDVVKIDAEGSELDVLQGAKTIIQQFKPTVILALHPPLIKNNNQSLDAIYDLLVEYNYTIFYESTVLSKDMFCAKKDFFDVHLISNSKK